MNWQLISFFGDSTVILPSAAITLTILLIAKASRLVAVQWGVLFVATGLVVSLSKLAFMGWGIGIPRLDFTGFSGHSALSAVFWPVFLWLLTASMSPVVRTLAAGLGFLLAVFIGYSRLMIHAHSASEVIAGLLLGTIASSLFFILQANQPKQALRRQFISIAVIPLVLLNTGVKAPTQSLLGEIALKLGPLEKVYTRGEMLKDYDEACIQFTC